ncbi:MAG: DUF2007 domain-containing protein [Paramuribaculum sp.]|nr:DUF2007 domain-containing protein [Paramuribaculum sp.]
MLSYNRNENEIVLCRTFSSDIEAHIAQAALEEEGLTCILENEIFSRLYPIGFNSIGGIRLMVKSRDMERAGEIVDSLSFEN